MTIFAPVRQAARLRRGFGGQDMAHPATAALAKVAIRLLQAPVYLYRYAISPLIGPVCRYQPTCSAYALEALEKHGPIVGLWLTAKRLARCHPIKWLGGSEGFDPVPKKHCEKHVHHDAETCR